MGGELARQKEQPSARSRGTVQCIGGTARRPAWLEWIAQGQRATGYEVRGRQIG